MSIKFIQNAFTIFVVISLFGGIVLADDKIKIGVSIRMISDIGFKHGKMMEDEIQMINESGGINGKMIELIFLNDECKSEKGIANAQKLIYQHKVHLLVGSSCSSVTLPMVDVSAKGGVPHITPHSTSSKITTRGSEWIFRVPISSRFYKSVDVAHIVKNVGLDLAYIISADSASLTQAEETRDLIKKEYGKDPLLFTTVQQGEMDFRSHMLKAKSLNPDALLISAGTVAGAAKALIQSYEVGIPASVKRILGSGASKQEIPTLAGDAVKGVYFTAAFSAADSRPIAKLFTRMIKEKYGVLPDHDFSQAWDLIQIIELALLNSDLKLTDDSLAADRTAIRDAIANIENYQGLASGPISFCADPTPECRDGNKTPVMIEYIKGGKDFVTRVLGTITFEPNHGL
jgi:ABC-type branched-subunit amino acid transport system substrate-binding protein